MDLRKIPKIGVIDRFMSSLMESLDERDQKIFCNTLSKSVDTMKIQIDDYVEQEWWGAAKRRSDSLKHLERGKSLCGV